MSEAQEQIALVEWCEWAHVPIFHIPNGGSRNKIEAANLKRQGVKAGVPDLFVPIAKSGFHGLFIEMKYGKNTLTHYQKIWLEELRDNGYRAEVCYSAKEAIDLIRGYLRV